MGIANVVLATTCLACLLVAVVAPPKKNAPKKESITVKKQITEVNVRDDVLAVATPLRVAEWAMSHREDAGRLCTDPAAYSAEKVDSLEANKPLGSTDAKEELKKELDMGQAKIVVVNMVISLGRLYMEDAELQEMTSSNYKKFFGLVVQETVRLICKSINVTVPDHGPLVKNVVVQHQERAKAGEKKMTN